MAWGAGCPLPSGGACQVTRPRRGPRLLDTGQLPRPGVLLLSVRKPHVHMPHEQLWRVQARPGSLRSVQLLPAHCRVTKETPCHPRATDLRSTPAGWRLSCNTCSPQSRYFHGNLQHLGGGGDGAKSLEKTATVPVFRAVVGPRRPQEDLKEQCKANTGRVPRV